MRPSKAWESIDDSVNVSLLEVDGNENHCKRYLSRPSNLRTLCRRYFMELSDIERRPRLLFLAVTFGIALFIIDVLARFTFEASSSIQSSPSMNESRSYFASYELGESSNHATFPAAIEGAYPIDLCDICNCHVMPSHYAPSPYLEHGLSLRPLLQHIRPNIDSVDVNEFVRLAILDMYCARQHLEHAQAFKLLRRAGTRLEDLMSWSLSGLDLGRPTIYLTTATSPGGKIAAHRPQYLRRSGRAIRSYLAQQTERQWQVVWIVVDDEYDIDPVVASTLRRTGVPYIYFAYGPTRSYGNAQKNAGLQLVYALSRPGDLGLLGRWTSIWP